jgi:chromosomal replication initiation ATPase DnaA
MSFPDAPSARQLPLDLPVEPRFGREDFLVSPSNADAYEMFERWPDWPDRVLILIGPEGAGKSHLAAIWADRVGAQRVVGANLPGAEARRADRASAYLLEDADRHGGDEAALFHFLNAVRTSRDFLAITSRRPPDAWGLATADLLSRMRQAPFVAIGAPDDALVRAVLVKLFLDRQLGVDTAVVDYLALRIERSLAAARAIVAALDREGLARGRPVTRPMAAEVLKRLDAAAHSLPPTS